MTKANIFRLVLLASLGTLLVYSSATSAVVSVARTKSYQTALALDSNDSIALAVKADNLFLVRQDPATLKQVKQLARQSVRSQAINARALRLIAYTDEALLPEPKSREFIDMATRLSRRELGTQIWLIEKSVAADDAVGALRHYDIALRTNTAIQIPLFVQLTAGIELPVIRQALAPYIRANTPWAPAFLTHAIAASENPASVATLVKTAGGMPKGDTSRDLEKYLLSQLFAKGQFAEAKEYYLSLPEAKPTVLTSLDFNPDNMSSSSGMLGWQLVQGASTGADWSGGSENQVMAAFANSGERGMVARKWLFLLPGNYRINLTFGDASMLMTGAIEWTMNCLSDRQPISAWRSGPLRPTSGTRTYGVATVTQDCPFQSIEIAMTGGEAQTGAELVVQSARIVRQR